MKLLLFERLTWSDSLIIYCSSLTVLDLFVVSSVDQLSCILLLLYSFYLSSEYIPMKQPIFLLNIHKESHVDSVIISVYWKRAAYNSHAFREWIIHHISWNMEFLINYESVSHIFKFMGWTSDQYKLPIPGTNLQRIFSLSDITKSLTAMHPP